MRLIDADALKDLIHSKSNGPEDLWDTMGVLNAINNTPTIPLPDEIYKKGYHAGFFATHGEPERLKGEWIVTAEDNDGVHRICCPFCSYEKGINNTYHIIVTFTNFPKFCENCGADMRDEKENNNG
jgi:hypothetical protein